MELEPDPEKSRPNFRFLSHLEFTRLSEQEKVAYLRFAIRAVATKVDDVLADKEPTGG